MWIQKQQADKRNKTKYASRGKIVMKRMIIVEVTRGEEDRFMNNVDKCQVIRSRFQCFTEDMQRQITFIP